MPRKPALRKIFHGKVLLFGEHIINRGARGFAVPVERYFGMFSFVDSTAPAYAVHSNEALNRLALYIINDRDLSIHFNTEFLLDEVKRGLFFESNIPEGYGLGSSGALVAAVYYRFQKLPRLKLSTELLRQRLAAIESCFHGKSSGLDPLVCYLNLPVQVNEGRAKMLQPWKKVEQPLLRVYLIDTCKPRDTATWVKLFLNRWSVPSFRQMVEKSLIPANDLCITALQQREVDKLMAGVKLISQIQWSVMKEFIPRNMHDAWMSGLAQNSFHFKICGAGGGGFMLCFAKTDVEVNTLLNAERVIPLLEI